MKYSLEDLSCISTQERKSLSSAGIHSADDILQRLALPEQRRQFSKTTHIPVDNLTHWAGLADLIRIKGMGVATAELLIQSGQVNSLQHFVDRMILEPAKENRATTGWQVIQHGVRNLLSLLSRTLRPSRPAQEISAAETVSSIRIAERETVRVAAQRLRQNLSAYAKENSTRKNIPGINRLAELAEEAVELRPRLVMDATDGGELFRQTMKSRAWGMSEVTLRLVAITVGFLVVYEIGATLITIKQIRAPAAPLQSALDGSSQIYRALQNVSGEARIESFAIFAAVLVLVLAFGLSLAALSPMFVSYPASTFLMNNTIHRSFFIKAIQVPLRREQRTSIVALILFALVVIALAIYTQTINFEINAQSLNPYSLPAAIFGGIIGLIASSATYLHVLVGVPIDWEQERESLKLYLLYMLIHIIFAFVGIYLVIYISMAGTNTVYNLIYERSILPRYLQSLDRTCEREALKLADNDPTSPVYYSSKDECDQFFKPLVLALKGPSVRMVNPKVSTWSEVGSSMKWAINTVVIWMILTGALLMFVLPYLSIGGWWRGIFYIVLLFVAARLEDLLRTNSARVLGLDGGTLGTSLIIGFFVLTSALLFDWLYDSLTEKKKVCPNCQSLIDNFVYCPVCGLAQP